MMRGLTIASTALLVCSSIAFAQNDTTESCLTAGENDSFSDSCIAKDDLLGSLDLSSPANPLFTLIGATPEKTIKPKPGESFALSYLPDAIDAFGQENTSIGIEINPGNLMMPEFISPQDLNPSSAEVGVSRTAPFGNSLERAAFLSQFTLSAAYLDKQGDIPSTQYGAGVSYIYDSRLPLFNNKRFRNCINAQGKTLVNAADGPLQFRSKLTPALTDAGIPDSASTEIVNAIEDELQAVQSGKSKRIPNFRDALKQIDITVTTTKDDGTVAQSQRKLTEEELSKLSSSLDNEFLTFDSKQLELFNDLVTGCGELVSRWNRPVYGGGLAIYRTEFDNQAADVVGMPTQPMDDETGWGIWASASFASPFGEEKKEVGAYSEKVSNGQFVISARYNDGLIRDRKVGDETITESVDGWSLGGRYVHQLAASQDQKTVNARAFRAFVEAAYSQEEFGDIDDEFYQLGIGAEFQLRKDLFFQFIIGDTFNSDIDRSTYLTGEFKWSFSSLAAQ